MIFDKYKDYEYVLIVITFMLNEEDIVFVYVYCLQL